MRNWKLYLGIVVVFLSGAVVGGVGTALVIRDRIEEVMFGGASQRIVKRLSRELQLSPEQRQVVEENLLAAEAEVRELKKKHSPEAEAIFDKRFEQMRPVLQPEQLEKLQRLRRQHKERRRDRERRWRER